MKTLPTILVILFFGLSIAALGLQELKIRPEKDNQQTWIAQKLRKEHQLQAASLVQVLHSNYNIETYAAKPAEIKDLKKHQDQDSLNQQDRSALKSLINKITTK